MTTDAEFLALIETAMADVITNGQHVTADGDSWTKADLGKLTELRDTFKAKVDAASGSFFDRVKTGIPRR